MSKARYARVAAGVALALAALVAACVHQTLPGGGVAVQGVAPQLAVESFMRAANCVASDNCATKAQQLDSLGKLFGTRDGPIVDRDPRADVEKRLFAIASLVKSDDYKLMGQTIVPGRVGEAVQVDVNLTQGEKTVRVPFIVVHAKSGDWLVEQIDTKALTQRP
jgi:hypothetical protein